MLPQGKAHHAAVFQNVVVDGLGHDVPVHPGQGAHRPGGQDVVNIVDALEGQGDVGLPADGQLALLQVQGGDRKVRLLPGVAAGGAVVVADVGVVVAGVLHLPLAHRAPLPVVVHAVVLLGAHRRLLHAEPLHLLMVPGKAGYQRVVSVEDQGGIRVDGGQDGVIDPLGVAVPGELVPVEVGDDKVGGVEIAEGVFGVALVALQQEHVPPHFAQKGAVGQNQGGDPLDLVGALLVVDHFLPRGGEDGGGHLHGGGLAVAPGDGDHIGGQGDPAQDIRAELQGVFSGKAAPLPHQLAHKANQLTDQNGQNFSHGVYSSLFMFLFSGQFTSQPAFCQDFPPSS